jgi:3-methyladenine DNA glycosylase AlkD
MIFDELRKLSSQKKAAALQRFFKTGKGEYGEGDKFLGVVVPDIRKIVKKYKDLPFSKINKALKSKYHEERLTALLILVQQFKIPDEKNRKKIFKLYLKSVKFVNNWDLVDLTAPNIVGLYLVDKKRDILYKLAKSKSLWEKRIAVLSTFQFIKNDDFSDSLKISKILLRDSHDLIHKAVGWMLREIGKRSLKTELNFLEKYYKVMPRTMLRYAIEKFSSKLRLKYLNS